MESSKLTTWLIGVGLGAGGAGALAAAGFYRHASFDELAVFEALGGIGIALYAYLRGARERKWRRREQGWARVEATITESAVARAYPWGGGDTAYYKPDVKYRFSLNGTEHDGKRVQIDAGSNTSSAEVAAWVARYPVGATVMAYCDPKDPSLSVLELDDDGGELVTIAYACLPVFLLAAAVFALLGRYPPA